jgi:ATP-binding cassette subfamily F protein 3
VLSGGEKARLALSRMLLRSANLLLLDEPTNHLDLAGREVLEEALDAFEGTLIFVSHDRYFMNRVATSIGEVAAGSISIYPGDYDTFLERRAPASTESAATAASAARDEPRARRRDAKRAEAEERNRLYREHKETRDEIARVESEIASLETEMAEIVRQQTDPDSYRDGEIAARLGRRQLQIEETLTGLYALWEVLASKI